MLIGSPALDPPAGGQRTGVEAARGDPHDPTRQSDDIVGPRPLFLRTVPELPGAVAAPWLMSRRLQSAVPARDRLRVGCIGVGGRGTLVGNTACRLGEKIACADVNLQHAERFAGDDSCAVYADYRQLLDRQDIDLVQQKRTTASRGRPGSHG